jgi:hypothetical protein
MALGYLDALRYLPRSLELISQNQLVIQQCFSLTTNQHQHQPLLQQVEQGD